jgi:hypothetical protein
MLPSRSILLPALIAAGMTAATFPATADSSERMLGSLIEQGLREGGPFFTADEQAVIIRACGYAPGEWDGFEFNMRGDILHCTNGRDVDDPAVRRVMRQAAPRIGRRVSAVMARADVRDAIDRISEEATARAMRELPRRAY